MQCDPNRMPYWRRFEFGTLWRLPPGGSRGAERGIRMVLLLKAVRRGFARLLVVALISLLAACGDDTERKGECEAGDERALVCGLNDRGLIYQVCDEHFKSWPYPRDEYCVDPDECVDGELSVG